MIALSDEPRRLTVDDLCDLAARLGVDVWPPVLDLRPTESSDASGRPTQDHDHSLHESGLLEFGAPTPWADIVIGALTMADRALELRTITAAGIRRAYVARHGHRHVVAYRDGDAIEVSMPELSTVADVGRIVSRFCSSVPAVEFTEFSAPADEFVRATEECASHDELVWALMSVGAHASDATRVAAALSQTAARTEIVACARDDNGVVVHTSGAIGVLESARGLILVVPGISPDGSIWTTVTPGRVDRIGRAVARLIETLSVSQWFG